MVKNTPSNAGDVGSLPGRGTKIPHNAGQLSPMPQREWYSKESFKSKNSCKKQKICHHHG